MFEHLYEWLRNLSFYLILVNAILYAVPENGYRKYIRFFTGLLLILMLISPVVQLLEIDNYQMEMEVPVEEYEKEILFEVEEVHIGD